MVKLIPAGKIGEAYVKLITGDRTMTVKKYRQEQAKTDPLKEFTDFMNREVVTVCLECGQKYDTKNKSSFGVWVGDCDICGKKGVPCADAAHDFGIYSKPEIKAKDAVDDLL